MVRKALRIIARAMIVESELTAALNLTMFGEKQQQLISVKTVFC